MTYLNLTKILTTPEVKILVHQPWQLSAEVILSGSSVTRRNLIKCSSAHGFGSRISNQSRVVSRVDYAFRSCQSSERLKGKIISFIYFVFSQTWLGPWNCSLLIRGHWVLDEESKTKWFSQNFVNKAEQKETKTKLFPSNLANEAEYKMTVGYLLLTQIALKWPTCSFPANVIICLTSVLLLRQMDH